jgi:hypothetical protein
MRKAGAHGYARKARGGARFTRDSLSKVVMSESRYGTNFALDPGLPGDASASTEMHLPSADRDLPTHERSSTKGRQEH